LFNLDRQAGTAEALLLLLFVVAAAAAAAAREALAALAFNFQEGT
tara:strand:- start:115 stop:249 length:135 start_codon:yes stop_codon:yes gene_type:complete